MKAPPLAKNYKCLTPEERFRLIMTASGRGDEAERDRLVHASGRITLSFQDHAPYAQAFDELGLLIFMDLLNEAASYRESFAFANSLFDADEAEEEEEEESDDAAETDVPDTTEEPDSLRALDIALASGYVLRTRAYGWKLFCERLNVPPFLLWEVLPGFDRLQRALALAEKAAFVPEGFLRWLNRGRPEGEPELTAVPITVEGVADTIAEAYRQGRAIVGRLKMNFKSRLLKLEKVVSETSRSPRLRGRPSLKGN
jgi:hypothetical protein